MTTVYVPKDIRKSDFIEVDSTSSVDYFDIVRNGQNFKISQPNLISDFGVSGPLQPQGETTAIPVLDVDAGVNYIRNILGGSGIVASVSAQDGVQIDHNFTVNKEGVPVMINETSPSPEIRSIEAGTGITVGGSGGTIQIATSGEVTSTKTVQVFTIDDFPTPVGGVITLEGDTEYRIQNDISSGNRYAMGENTVVSGADGTVVTLEYTGSAVMFTALDVSFKLRDCSFSCPNGTLWNISSTTGTHLFRMYITNIYCDIIGTIDNMQIVFLWNANFRSVTTDGLTVTGNFNIFFWQVVGATMLTGANDFLDITGATFDRFIWENCFFIVNTTGYIVNGLANSANINIDGLGVFVRCTQFGTTFPLNNISPFDNLWEIFQSSDVPNSRNSALANNAGTTVVIAAANTPVVIGAAWVAQEEYRFTINSSGRFTYTGPGSHINVQATLTADAASSTHDYTVYIYKNGVQETASGIQRVFQAGSPGNISLIWGLDLVTNDYVEFWVENNTGTVDFNVIQMIARME